jgi:hypothetical protein
MITHSVRRTALSLVAGALAGCSGAISPPAAALPQGTPPIFSFLAPTQVVATAFHTPSPGTPPRTAIGARFTNGGTTGVTLEYGACSVAVWLYRAGIAGGGPTWENALPAGSACIAIGYSTSLAPGASFDVPGVTLGASTLSAPPPPGTYEVRVAIRRRTSGGSSETLEVLDGGTLVVP